jgi:hypothetical protein
MDEFQRTRSVANREMKLWKKLWEIRAPGKMIFTLWWFGHDCLPSGG